MFFYFLELNFEHKKTEKRASEKRLKEIEKELSSTRENMAAQEDRVSLSVFISEKSSYFLVIKFTRKFNEDANQKKIAELREKLKKYYKLYEEAKVRNL